MSAGHVACSPHSCREFRSPLATGRTAHEALPVCAQHLRRRSAAPGTSWTRLALERRIAPLGPMWSHLAPPTGRGSVREDGGLSIKRHTATQFCVLRPTGREKPETYLPRKWGQVGPSGAKWGQVGPGGAK